MIKLIFAIITGAIVGSIAGKIMDSKLTFWKNAALGILGGAVGGFVGTNIGIGEGFATSFILAVAGSCLLIWIGRQLKKNS